MTYYRCANRFGKFSIEKFENGHFAVFGNIKAAAYAFNSINRRPPNKFGTFYGRENAGKCACEELLKVLGNGGNEFIYYEE